MWRSTLHECEERSFVFDNLNCMQIAVPPARGTCRHPVARIVLPMIRDSLLNGYSYHHTMSLRDSRIKQGIHAGRCATSRRAYRVVAFFFLVPKIWYDLTKFFVSSMQNLAMLFLCGALPLLTPDDDMQRQWDQRLESPLINFSCKAWHSRDSCDIYRLD